MPVFKSGKGLAPKWCELECFDVVRLGKGQKHTYVRIGNKEKLIVGKGACRIAFGGQKYIFMQIEGKLINYEKI